MTKKYFIITTLVLSIPVAVTLSFAQMECGGHSSGEHKLKGADATTQASPAKAVNVENKICPVSGDKIDEKLKATYEYKGKIYNFCCASCIDEFKKDPQKYIKKVEEELQADAKKQKSKQEESHAESSHSH